VRVLKAKNAAVFTPIDSTCNCYTCSNYTVSYLHHLFRAHELTAYALATTHNIHYMLNKMKQYRELILQDLV
jgi:queuine tRNA-ribosyltransferase